MMLFCPTVKGKREWKFVCPFELTVAIFVGTTFTSFVSGQWLDHARSRLDYAMIVMIVMKLYQSIALPIIIISVMENFLNIPWTNIWTTDQYQLCIALVSWCRHTNLNTSNTIIKSNIRFVSVEILHNGSWFCGSFGWSVTSHLSTEVVETDAVCNGSLIYLKWKILWPEAILILILLVFF